MNSWPVWCQTIFPETYLCHGVIASFEASLLAHVAEALSRILDEAHVPIVSRPIPSLFLSLSEDNEEVGEVRSRRLPGEDPTHTGEG
jgi:hypothetical protein